MSSATWIRRRSESQDPATLLTLVLPDLEAVERRLQREISAEVRQVYDLGAHLLCAGGKRLRPAMVSLSARAVCASPPADRIETVATVVEMVHMATLVHDDVVDNTATRRGKPTANAVFGNGVAVLSGDYLLAKAMRLLAADGELRMVRTVSEITMDMSEGEVMEILFTGRADIALSDYFEVLRKKTAVFVEGCCRCGAILGGASQKDEAALAEYGYRLGMAFQIADDLLDYTGDPAVTGKPAGSDLRDGRATLPLLLTLSDADSADNSVLLDAFARPDLMEDEMARVVQILTAHSAFDRTRCMAREHVELADAALDILPDTPARNAFSALTEYVVQRDK